MTPFTEDKLHNHHCKLCFGTTRLRPCICTAFVLYCTDISDASNKIVGLAEDVDAGPLDDVPKANGAVIGCRGGDGPVELNPGHASVVTCQSQYHIADIDVPDDNTRILQVES